MRTAFVLLTSAAFTLHPSRFSFAQGPTEVNGNIRTDTTWTLDGSPYIVTGDIWVYGTANAPATLTIEPGVEVRFDQDRRLTVGWTSFTGALTAVGNAGEPILFTSNQTTRTRGYWGRVELTSATDTALTVMEHVTVEYGGSGSRGNVFVNGSSPTLRHCTIQESANYGIYVYDTAASPVLEATIIQRNAESGIYVRSGDLSLQDVTFGETEADYAISMLVNTTVRSFGTHTFDKPIELRNANITGDVTWRNLGVPYVSTGSSMVYGDATTPAILTVEPGVEVRFSPGKQLIIGTAKNDKGTLIAQGDESSPITFTSGQTEKSPGDWKYLLFEKGSVASVLEHVTVEYGGSATAAVYVKDSAPTFRNSAITSSKNHGIYVTGSGAPHLESVQLDGNAENAIYVSSGALILQDVTSSRTGGDYAISLHPNSPVTATGENRFDKPIVVRYGTVSTDLTWQDLGAPYVVWSTLWISKDTTEPATLTIAPGVEVQFRRRATLIVGSPPSKGALIAQGTPDAPIVFTSDQDVKTPGYWNRIEFSPSTATGTLLEHTVIEYAGSGGYGLRITGSSPVIRNSTIRNTNNDGVYVWSVTAFPELQDNNFINIPNLAVNNSTPNGIDARASWWSHASGPSGTADGLGERVSANVFYMPWLESEQNPRFTVTDSSLSHTTFDKHSGSTTLTAAFSAPAEWSLQIMNEMGDVVKAESGSGDTVEKTWDGEQTGGDDKVGDGLYTLRLTASSAGQAMAPLIAKVTVEGGPADPNAPIALITSPEVGSVWSGGRPVPIVGTAKDGDDFASYRVEYGAGTSPQSWTAITSPPDITTQVEDGELASWPTESLTGSTYRLRLTVRDTSSQAVAETMVNLLTLLNLQSSEPYISPDGDFEKDATTIRATITMPSNWELSIRDAKDKPVRSFSGSGSIVNVTWDGRDDKDKVVPDGAYSYVLEATHPTSGVSAVPASGIVYVDLTGPTAEITYPLPGEQIHDTVSITGTADEPGGIALYRLDYGPGTSPSTWRTVGTTGNFWKDPVVNGLLAGWQTNSFTEAIPVMWGNGVHTLRLQVRDLAGNESEDRVTIELDNLYISQVSAGSDLINPLQGETTEITFELNRDATEARLRIVPEQSPWKQHPDQSPESDAVRTIELGPLGAGSHSAVWDGKDDSGAFVPPEAYIYVIEARTSSGRFDKFNQFELPNYIYPSPSSVSIPPESTEYDPSANDFISHTFDLDIGPARGSFRVEYTDSAGNTHQLWPMRDRLLSEGQNTVSWDGRDEAGNIVTDITSINYMIQGFIPGCDPCSEDDKTSFHWVKKNFVQVEGTAPDLPLVSIKSDPYVMVLTYGHVVGLRYELMHDADVTVSVEFPDGTRRVLSSESQTAGEHEVIWDGTDDSGALLATAGHYAFTVTATMSETGASVSRKGNIIVRK